jgi:hypothetical protein
VPRLPAGAGRAAVRPRDEGPPAAGVASPVVRSLRERPPVNPRSSRTIPFPGRQRLSRRNCHGTKNKKRLL